MQRSMETTQQITVTQIRLLMAQAQSEGVKPVDILGEVLKEDLMSGRVHWFDLYNKLEKELTP